MQQIEEVMILFVMGVAEGPAARRHYLLRRQAASRRVSNLTLDVGEIDEAPPTLLYGGTLLSITTLAQKLKVSLGVGATT